MSDPQNNPFGGFGDIELQNQNIALGDTNNVP